jgi:hypothetical protein
MNATGPALQCIRVFGLTLTGRSGSDIIDSSTIWSGWEGNKQQTVDVGARRSHPSLLVLGPVLTLFKPRFAVQSIS